MKVHGHKGTKIIVVFLIFAYHSGFSQPSNWSLKANNADNQLKQFYNKIYHSFYNPDFIKTEHVSVYSILKIVINENGEISSYDFSDSADSEFKNAFLNKAKSQDYMSTLKNYIETNELKSISLLIPVSYEFEKNDSLNVFHIARKLWLFNNEVFIGKALMLRPVRIQVATKWND